jgi:hypothetical protein
MEWVSEGANADVTLGPETATGALADALEKALGECDDNDLVPDGDLVRRRQPRTEKASAMTKNVDNDSLLAEVEQIFKGLPPDQQATVSRFLGQVMAEQDRLRKGKTDAEDLAELKTFLLDCLNQVLTGQASSLPNLDGAELTRPKPVGRQPQGFDDALHKLAARLVKQAIDQRRNLIVAEQDARGLTGTDATMVAAREDARRRDAEGEPMRKDEGRQEREPMRKHATTGSVEYDVGDVLEEIARESEVKDHPLGGRRMRPG